MSPTALFSSGTFSAYVQILSTWDNKIRKEMVWREIRIPVDMPNRNVRHNWSIVLV